MIFQDVRFVSAAEALSVIQSGHRVFVHGSAATPHFMIKKLAERAPELRNVEIVSLSTLGEVDFAKPEFRESFYINALFVSANIRNAIENGQGDYIPIFLSDIPDLFDMPWFKLDVAIVHVSPPDRHGFCSLGVSVDVARTAIHKAKYVIAQVNPRMPRSHGDGLIHVSKFHALVEVNEELPEVNYENNSEIGRKIGRFCAELIEDGSTLQMGIGEIPDSVLKSLTNHKHIGIHTEMFSDGVLPLVESGVITNEKKAKHPGKLVATFITGTRKIYDFIDDNPEVVLLDADYVNEPSVIAQNPKVVAINSAIEIDLTGQICADSIGFHQFSGVGGQMDFIRGAASSVGGKPIIAMPSMTSKGVSRIVPFLNTGAGVVTTRAHVHYVVTEYGIAYLFGKNFRQRAKALIDIAHPDHREELEKAAFDRFGGRW